jgi:hypothetical protein
MSCAVAPTSGTPSYYWQDDGDLAFSGRSVWGSSPSDLGIFDAVGKVRADKDKIAPRLVAAALLGSRIAAPSGPLAIGGTVYLYGPEGLPVEQIDSSDQALFYHHDQSGTTRALTGLSPGSHVLDVYGVDTWGNEKYHSGPDTIPFGFGGYYTDPVSHLVLMGHDWYDPRTGQRIRRAITVGQNAPVLLRRGIWETFPHERNAGTVGNPAVLSIELFFDAYEKGVPAGEVQDCPPTLAGRVLRLGVRDTCNNAIRVGGESGRSFGLSPYAFGGGDPVNGVVTGSDGSRIRVILQR